MTDQIFYEELRATIRDAIASYLDTYTDEELRELTTESLSLPPRPTLADMTLDEQDECRGMQADLAQGDRVVILDGHPGLDGRALVLGASLDTFRPTPEDVTPRPDLARLTWPGTEKPAPDLPGDWRIADHKENGRVMVTTAPDRYRRVYYVLHFPEGGMGFDWLSCDDSELTYLDTEP